MGQVCKRDKLGEMLNFEGLVDNFFLFLRRSFKKGTLIMCFYSKKISGSFFFHEDIVVFSSFFIILHFLISLAKKWGSGPKLLRGLKTSKTNFRGLNYLIFILARHSTLLNCWKHTSLTHTTSKIIFAHLHTSVCKWDGGWSVNGTRCPKTYYDRKYYMMYDSQSWHIILETNIILLSTPIPPNPLPPPPLILGSVGCTGML